mmetsp:Transcript_28039/g.32683  ORF Transcript_28039/g.32683 Transcript_28039/m.32683 type:complete len:231 (+) Transcript_28039:65-757(+)
MIFLRLSVAVAGFEAILLFTLIIISPQRATGFIPMSPHRSGKSRSHFSVKGTSFHQSFKRISMQMNMSNDDREIPTLTTFLDKASNTGIDNTSVKINSLVVAKYDVPQLGIFADQTYELCSVYLRGVNRETGEFEKIPLSELNLTGIERDGYTLYITLFNSMYHNSNKFTGEPVICTPEEVGLISMRDEVFDSVLVAIPILSFWIGTCFVFVSKYNQRYGGDFFDAFFGR